MSNIWPWKASSTARLKEKRPKRKMRKPKHKIILYFGVSVETASKRITMWILKITRNSVCLNKDLLFRTEPKAYGLDRQGKVYYGCCSYSVRWSILCLSFNLTASEVKSEKRKYIVTMCVNVSRPPDNNFILFKTRFFISISYKHQRVITFNSEK